MADWRSALLKAVGAPVTPGNLRFLASWQRWEGGHTNNKARFNWLNTTHGNGTPINSVGVKAFPTFNDGIFALGETLMNGRYDDIVQALKTGHPYKHDLSAGLETWVSGSPTGNPAYAAKIMGTKGGAPKAALPGGGRGPTGNPGLAPSFDPGPRPDPFEALYIAFADDPQFVNTLKSFRSQMDSAVSGIGPKAESPTPVAPAPKGPGIHIPSSWKGTHVTDGLGWGTKTAEDIMGAPGTPVSLPEDVTVVYYHPTGAQGGGSMLVRTSSGREYWLGHIEGGAAPGTHVPAGQAVTFISPDHPRPHVHVDRRG